VADPGFAKGGERGWTMVSTWSTSINGGLGWSPQWGPGAEPMVEGQGAKLLCS